MSAPPRPGCSRKCGSSIFFRRSAVHPIITLFFRAFSSPRIRRRCDPIRVPRGRAIGRMILTRSDGLVRFGGAEKCLRAGARWAGGHKSAYARSRARRGGREVPRRGWRECSRAQLCPANFARAAARRSCASGRSCAVRGGREVLRRGWCECSRAQLCPAELARTAARQSCAYGPRARACESPTPRFQR